MIPLDGQETKQMIGFRLQQAGFNSGKTLFTDEALRLIFARSQGYPRKIAILCHNALASCVMQQRSLVDRDIIQTIINEDLKIGQD